MSFEKARKKFNLKKSADTNKIKKQSGYVNDEGEWVEDFDEGYGQEQAVIDPTGVARPVARPGEGLVEISEDDEFADTSVQPEYGFEAEEGGFSQEDLDFFKEYSAEQGIDFDTNAVLQELFSDINSNLQKEYVTYDIAKEEIINYIDMLGSEDYVTEEAPETVVETEAPIEEEPVIEAPETVEAPVEAPAEAPAEAPVTQTDELYEDNRGEIEEVREQMAEADEAAVNEDQDTGSKFNFSDLLDAKAVKSDKTNFFGISNYFMPTDQSKLFKENFPPEGVVETDEFMESLVRLASKIKSRYSYPGGAAQRLGLLDRGISREERVAIVSGYLWQAMEAALGTNHRMYDYGAQGDLRDSRLAIFVNNEDLVPDHLQEGWGDVKKSWDYQLQSEIAKDQTRYNKDVQKALASGYSEDDIVNTRVEARAPGKAYVRPLKKSITGPTKEKLLSLHSDGTLGNDLQEHLSELLKAGDQRVLPGILRRAEDIAAYAAYKEFPHKEKSMPTATDDQGEERSVAESADFDKTVVDRIESRMSPEERINSVRDGSVLVKGFMDEMQDVMGTYVDSLSGVSQSSKDAAIGAVDLVSLKSELFKRQVSDLFSNATFLRKPEEVKDPELRKLLKLMDDSGEDCGAKCQKQIDSMLEKLAPGESYATPQGIFNNRGRIRWDKTGKSSYSNQMANTISTQTATQYNNLLYKMKADIKNVSERLQSQGLAGSSDLYDRIRESVSSNAAYQDKTLAGFLNDDNFIKHTLEQSQKYIDARSELTSQQYTSQSGQVWGRLAADALIAFIRGKGKLEKEISTLMPEEREKRIKDFQIARQNFLTFIRYHASLGPKPEGSPKDKIGGHAKLKGILEDIGPGLYKELGINKLNGRDMISMIAGGPLSPRLKQIFTLLESKLSRWEGYKQAVAVYVNMMTKIAKLRKMNRKMIRMAATTESVKNVQDQIADIHRRGMFMIRQLLG